MSKANNQKQKAPEKRRHSLAPAKIELPMDRMKFWYMASKEELVEEVKGRYGDKVIDIENPTGYCLYVMKSPQAKWLLVHHIDTVQKHSTATFVPYQIGDGRYLHSPHNDDRIGIAAAMEVLEHNGYTAFDILITDMEEVGRTTAGDFMDWLDKSEEQGGPTEKIRERIAKYRGIIEFDRGGADYVTYSYRNAEAEAFMKECGFPKGTGSFSDIAAMYDMGIYAMNLGTGYRSPHSANGWASLDVYAWSIAHAIAFMRHFGRRGGHVLKNEGTGGGRWRSAKRKHQQNNKPPASNTENKQTPPANNKPKNKPVGNRSPHNCKAQSIQSATAKGGNTGIWGSSFDWSSFHIQSIANYSFTAGKQEHGLSCIRCGSDCSSMGKFAKTCKFSIDGELKFEATLCEPCYYLLMPVRLQCVNKWHQKSLRKYNWVPMSSTIPGADGCKQFCTCRSDRVAEQHELLWPASTLSVDFIVDGDVQYKSLQRKPSFVTGPAKNFALNEASFRDDLWGFKVVANALDKPWWRYLFWSSNDLLGLVRPSMVQPFLGKEAYKKWDTLTAPGTVLDYLMKIKEIQGIK